jgi:hypothetical protein
LVCHIERRTLAEDVQDRMPKKIVGPKRDELTGEWTRLYNELYGMIYLSTALGLTPGGSGTVHIYTQTMHRTKQLTTKQYE